MFDPDESVRGGPLDWLAALTPFATLVPAMSVWPPVRIELDADGMRRLLGDDDQAVAAVVRAALGCRDIAIEAARLRSGSQ